MVSDKAAAVPAVDTAAVLILVLMEYGLWLRTVFPEPEVPITS